MVDRIPLIVNPGANQIQETPTNDRLIVGLTTIATNAGINQTGVITATTFNATSSFTGPGATFGNITIAVVNDQTIATTSGDLVIDPNSNTDINSDVDISGSLTLSSTTNTGTTFVQNATTDSSSKTTGAATFAGGVGIEKKLNVGDDITAFASSDGRLKDNVTPIPNALDKVLSISGNTFNWNAASDYEGQGGTGVIAQEIDKLNLPGVVDTRDNGTLAVRYDRLVPLLIEAIKELKAEVDELKTHTH